MCSRRTSANPGEEREKKSDEVDYNFYLGRGGRGGALPAPAPAPADAESPSMWTNSSGVGDEESARTSVHPLESPRLSPRFRKLIYGLLKLLSLTWSFLLTRVVEIYMHARADFF